VKRKLIIAIDGPAGSGKSTTAREVAKRLKLPYIDTGAMYRAVTLKAMRESIPLSSKERLVAAAKRARIELHGKDPNRQKVFLDGKDVTKDIREPELTKNVFHVAQEPLIRREMVKKQRALGRRAGAVMEGRDIGTVVFPRADFKFYFDSNPALRALRRWRELSKAGKKASLAQVEKELKKRDLTDLRRKESPLKRARDAYYIDTTPLTIDETADRMIAIIVSKHHS
jgi:cytidylate kinase